MKNEEKEQEVVHHECPHYDPRKESTIISIYGKWTLKYHEWYIVIDYCPFCGVKL